MSKQNTEGRQEALPALEQSAEPRWPRVPPFVAEALERAGGAMPFRDYMALALYHPQHGYYMTPKARTGRAGDFVTAPEMTSVFGELLTLQCVEIWEAMGRPTPFQLVEAGPGSGKLALDILSTAQRFPPFAEALRYTLVEVSPDYSARQRQRLAAAGFEPPRVAWRERLETLGAIDGVILSNELLDAMPVHWLERGGDGDDGVREHWVTRDQRGELVTELRPPEGALAAALGELAAAGVALPPGNRGELGLDARRWLAGAARQLRRGVILTIDYGFPASELYAPVRRFGTLMGFHQHRQVENPLAHPGEMDLTAHVDFSALARAGEGAGLATLGFTTQAWFLMGLGVLERMEGMRARAPQDPATAGVMQAVFRLIMPQGMGERFKVLAQGRGMEGVALSGFRLNDQRNRL